MRRKKTESWVSEAESRISKQCGHTLFLQQILLEGPLRASTDIEHRTRDKDHCSCRKDSLVSNGTECLKPQNRKESFKEC